MQCFKCSLSGAIVITTDFWGYVRRAVTYCSVFQILSFALPNKIREGEQLKFDLNLQYIKVKAPNKFADLIIFNKNIAENECATKICLSR